MSRCIFCRSELTTGDIDNICSSCRNTGLSRLFEPPVIQSSYYSPWICPRCGVVHAAWVSRCDCPPPSTTRDSTQLNIDF